MSISVAVLVISLRFGLLKPSPTGFAFFGMVTVLGNLLPDFLSLLKCQYLLKAAMGKSRSMQCVLLMLDAVLSGAAAVLALNLGIQLATRQIHQTITATTNPLALASPQASLTIDGTLQPDFHTAAFLWILPAFFTSIWLWLYAGSGFLLKAARRFDTGFDWFNRHFDIEKKPLQAIGLVAGALVAVVYWAAVIVSRVVR
jgi:hypothetical protein